MSKFNRREFLSLSGAAPLALPFLSKFSVYRDDATAAVNLTDPWLEINLQHVAWNLNQIRKRVSSRPVMGVIKANAYGHGLVEMAKFLEQQKIHALAVGKVQEAVQLRQNEVKIPVLNFGPFSSDEAEELVRLGISQSVYTDAVSDLAKAARKLNKKAKIHILVDTGLGRVGVPYRQALSFVEKVASMPEIKIEGIFTTFTEDKEYDKIQLKRFRQICETARSKGIDIGLKHAASSAGVLAFADAYLDMVRPGIMLYGQYPSTEEYKQRKLNLKPVMSVKAKVILVKTLQPGESVSYHRKFMAESETRVATLPIGYSDGWFPVIAEKGEAIVQGNRFPLIAAITCNHATIDITSGSDVKIGDEVVFMGEQGNSKIAAEEVAAWANTSVYKVLIGMNPLLPRIYTGRD